MSPVERRVEGLLGNALVRRVVERLRGLEPDTSAVLLTGSYAKGTATTASDLDLVAISPSRRVAYRTWFEEHGEDAPLHVSAAATTPEAWLERTTTPAPWSLGFRAINDAAYLYADDETRALLGDDPSLRHPAAEPELEDFLDFALKAKRAAQAGDDLGLRWFALAAATLAPRLLIPLNNQRTVCDRRDALDAALKLAVAPGNYAADLATSLGLTPASGGEVRTAVTRLASELLTFLREHAPDVDQQPDIARYLTDGTLERHLGPIE